VTISGGDADVKLIGTAEKVGNTDLVKLHGSEVDAEALEQLLDLRAVPAEMK
jgi:hypothetical protein